MKKTALKKRTILLALLLICMAVGLGGTSLAEEGAASGQTIDLTGLCNAVIAVLGALVTYRLIPWIRARTSQSQQEGLTACAKTLVYAAEQLYRTGTIQDRLEYVEKGLAARGYSFDRAAIEAAVTQLRSDTCAYLKDLNMEVAGDGDVWISEAKVGAQIPADAASQAAGERAAPGAEAVDCAEDCAEEEDQAGKENEEEDG